MNSEIFDLFVCLEDSLIQIKIIRSAFHGRRIIE